MTAPNVITEINNKAAIERQGRRIKHSKMLLFLHTLLTVRPLATLGVLSAMTELVIELLSHRNPLQTFAHLGGNPMVFLLNTAIIFSTLLFALLFRRKSFYSVLVILLWLILGIINCAALTIRATPFSARDFSVFASGLMIADVYFTPLEIIGMCTGIALFSLFVVFLFTLAPRDEKRRFQAKGFLTVSALSMSLLLICFFGTRNIKLSEQYESINAAYETWGFPYCFTTTIFENGVSRPEDYSTEEVSDLGVDGTIAAAKCPNIILIQLESFFDPALIRNVELAENPIPHFTELRDSCASGYLHMPTLGAGTVNAEFEVLTGMSLDYFGLNEYPYESVLRETTCESIAYYLKELGYRAHAIHNYAGSFYGRNEVYPNLGFDDYTSVEYMSCVEYTEKEWPKDAVLTNYILQALEQTETPDFVFAVTVQCHGKYPDDSMVEDIRFNENHVFDDSASEQFLYYANQLKETDQFLGELIAALQLCDEEVVVVAYGDHLPTLELTGDDMVNGTLFQTQYFVWSNFGAGVGGEDEDLSAYQLTAHLFDIIGMAGGAVTEYHREHRGLDDYQEGLEMLEYDLLYGDLITYGGKNPYTKTDMKMGLDEIVVTGVVFGESTVAIIGSGFTDSSVVYVNGKRREDSSFVSSDKLLVPNNSGEIDPEDDIQVCQTGENRIILSTATRLS